MTETHHFSSLNLDSKLLQALDQLGYEKPTEIQSKTIPLLLENKDLLGCAQTGTGKTAAFSLPLLHKTLSFGEKFKYPTSLILAPTRELAIQIKDNIIQYSKFTGLRTLAVYGGASINMQIKSLADGVDILVATPGRLLDLLHQNKVSLKYVNTFVLDEADRMLDMGFIDDIKKIISVLPKNRQNALFSATLSSQITQLAGSFLKNPVRIDVAPSATPSKNIDQKIYFVETAHKKDLLKHLLSKPEFTKVIVFTRTKHAANRIAELLQKNKIPSLAIHGNKSQGARNKALDQLKQGQIQVLVATDVMARGIDISETSHVINFEVPHIAENYVHRIGRTGRASATGAAISFCNAEEKAFIKDIEQLMSTTIPIDKSHPYHSVKIEQSVPMSAGKAKALIEGGGKKRPKSSNDRSNGSADNRRYKKTTFKRRKKL